MIVSPIFKLNATQSQTYKQTYTDTKNNPQNFIKIDNRNY